MKGPVLSASKTFLQLMKGNFKDNLRLRVTQFCPIDRIAPETRTVDNRSKYIRHRRECPGCNRASWAMSFPKPQGFLTASYT